MADARTQSPEYTPPTLVDYGDLREITANNAIPMFVDVPQGTPVGAGPVTGDEPFPQMS